MTYEERKLLSLVDKVVGEEIDPTDLVVKEERLFRRARLLQLPQTGQLRQLPQTGSLGTAA